jgi:molybdopterin converting factor subunit 1
MAGGLRILAFAGARDVLGTNEVMLDVPRLDAAGVVTVEQLLDELCSQYPALTRYRPLLRVAVNSTYCDRGDPVRSGDEVALIPPVAGG